MQIMNNKFEKIKYWAWWVIGIGMAILWLTGLLSCGESNKPAFKEEVKIIKIRDHDYVSYKYMSRHTLKHFEGCKNLEHICK